MFKIIMFVRKKEGLSTEEFIKLWEAHSQKVINYKEALLIKDYTKTFPFQPADEKSSTQRETLPFTFDAMGELWYESKDDFLRARNTCEGQKALADLRADELKFVDMANSVMWLGTEERIFDKLPFEAKSWTVLDEYFYLSDYAGNRASDFEKLMALFSEDITMLSADGTEMKGKVAVISFYKAFFDRNKTTRHLWETTKVGEDTLETHWAVSGKRKDGSFFAFKGKDIAKLNSEGKIYYLKVMFL